MAFLYLFPFHSLLRLTSFLSQNKLPNIIQRTIVWSIVATYEEQEENSACSERGNGCLSKLTCRTTGCPDRNVFGWNGLAYLSSKPNADHLPLKGIMRDQKEDNFLMSFK